MLIKKACILHSRASAENFSGGATEKDQKLAKIAPFSLLQGGQATEKKTEKQQKVPKIALLSLYLLYLYHV